MGYNLYDEFFYFMLVLDDATNFSANDICLDLDLNVSRDSNVHFNSPSIPDSKSPGLFSINGDNKEANLLEISDSVASNNIMEFKFEAKLLLGDSRGDRFAITEIFIPRSNIKDYVPGLDQWVGYSVYLDLLSQN